MAETRKLDMRTLHVLTRFAEEMKDLVPIGEPDLGELNSAVQNAKWVMEAIKMEVTEGG